MSPEELNHQEKILRQTQRQYTRDEENTLGWTTVKFTSSSKGIIKSGPKEGHRRFRKADRIVELTWYGGKLIKENIPGIRIDEKAQEAFGDTVDGMDQQDTLVERLGRLRRLRSS